MIGKFLRISCVAVLLFVAQSAVFGQAKIYTRKAKLEDFPIKTMKVIVDGESPLAIDLRNEISNRWRLSPYEFCSAKDYEVLKNDNSFYFLRLVTDEGIAFMLLEKGGMESDENRLRKPFEVLRVPIGSAGESFSFGISNVDVYLDILQMFVQKAMESDKFGYFGLEVYNTVNMKGKTVTLDVDADEEFAKGTEGVVVPVVFTPNPEGTWCFKMLIDAGTHELFFFDKKKYKEKSDAEFNKIELKSFELRHAVVTG